MKKRTVLEVLLALLCIGVLTLAFNVVPVSASLPVHNIDTSEDFAAIQEAIDDPDTLDGHTISVEAGTYYEHVVVDKALSLVGENWGTTILDGSRTGTVVYVVADYVTVTGFRIQNSKFEYWYSGIMVDGSVFCNITNNLLTGNLDAILLTYSANITISNNVIIGNEWNGIHLKYDCHSNKIEGNSVLGNYKGIHLQGNSNGNYILDNYIANSEGIGIELIGSQNNSIQGNTITSCITGLYFGSETDNMNIIYHNNLINNVHQVTCYAALNIWDDGYPSGGNYWSDHVTVDDYSGVDQDELGSDGIVDIPYIINADNRDHYPLVDGFFISTQLLPIYDLFVALNSSYYSLLADYNTLLDDYNSLLADYDDLQDSYNTLATSFNTLTAAHTSLATNYTNLQDSYDSLSSNYDTLQAEYSSLESSYNALQSQYDALTDDLNTATNLNYLFIATTIGFIIATAYLAIRKPKPTQNLSPPMCQFHLSLIPLLVLTVLLLHHR